MPRKPPSPPPPPEPEPEPEEEGSSALTPDEVREILREAKENPFAHFDMRQIQVIFRFGRSAMKKIKALHPPMAFGKLNPAHFQKWLWENRESVGELKA